MHYLDSNIRDVGVICYGKALRRLARNLEDPILCQDPANIAAALMLSRYEVSKSHFSMGQAHTFQDSGA